MLVGLGRSPAGVLSHKFVGEVGVVGRSPWTAADALVRLFRHATLLNTKELFRMVQQPDQGVRRGRGRPPHEGIMQRTSNSGH
jgi:hypothetical protein